MAHKKSPGQGLFFNKERGHLSTILTAQKKNPRNVDITTFLGFNPMLFKEHFN
ncbi:hypothetical protein [Bacillus siamensis]|uniref:hypothetical protein n=1 Tax=Bacillus siamensis TaxID=659243 RepID=UPI002915CB3A|nr:hypothetical protein [Bacillus siamensis]